MEKIQINTEEFNLAKATYNKYIIKGNYGYFFGDEEDLPSVPEQPEYTDNQTLSLSLEEVEGVLEYAWEVVDKTEEEIKKEHNKIADEIDSSIPTNIISELLMKIVQDNIDDTEIDKYYSVFPAYRIDKAYEVDERFSYNENVYEVIQAHTSQLSWIPSELPAIYKKINNPEVISEWVQPQGAHDAYQVGDKVTYLGDTYENTLANNTYAPDAYGWIKL